MYVIALTSTCRHTCNSPPAVGLPLALEIPSAQLRATNSQPNPLPPPSLFAARCIFIHSCCIQPAGAGAGLRDASGGGTSVPVEVACICRFQALAALRLVRSRRISVCETTEKRNRKNKIKRVTGPEDTGELCVEGGTCKQRYFRTGTPVRAPRFAPGILMIYDSPLRPMH